MTKSRPIITVLMPVYNVASYVREAIDSILNQTFTDFELLIINDGSTDTTRDEVLKISDNRIRFVENENNIGLANTLNRGLELANGEYIARMDGDDISMSNRFEKQLAILEQYPDIDICGAGYEFFGSRNYKVMYPEYHEHIKVGLLLGCYMIIPMFRKEVVLKAGIRYNQDYFPAEDYRFWTECMLAGMKMHNVQEILFRYRMHPTQVSEVMTNQSTMSVMVRKTYFNSFFNDEQLASQFVESYCNDNALTTTSDIRKQETFLKKMILLNKAQKKFNVVFFNKRLRAIFYKKTVDYIHQHYFQDKYSVAGFIKLFFSGLFFKLSLKIQVQMLIGVTRGKAV